MSPEAETYRPCISTTDNEIFDIEGSVGPIKVIENRYRFIPLFGFGSHRWNRFGDPLDESDYDERYHWYYSFYGLRFDKVTNCFCFGASVKFKHTLKAKVTVEGLIENDVQLMFKNHKQYALDLYGRYQLKNIDMQITLFYKNENIGIGYEKQIKTSLYKEDPFFYLPSSNTNVLGIRFIFGYRF